MASPTLNVVRYTALLSGLFYGIIHRRSLQSAENIKREHHHEHRQEQLLQQAKEAWKQKQAGPKDDGVITDPENPKFDLEKLISKWEKESS
ncbi:hypothetical protein SISNIDRAFT_549697 [Sistotremastrum niveocremeum HHB9708]|uniref:ATP synthase F(0) complex subunit e, mitochondrial n=2 Tax=Sistotremastraceae TaxID=3402574 RepID=A0A164UKJ3_9AGAM|nr:hypothetical protein SISNIDRAFT_549697 [Sistotremastrum niveocremeum HHB9708]KZT43882.1 hypothetical protein SISSUDRAFT_1124545 [Sistotremastrum suecicum HHB10207 ss-3]